MNIVIHRKEPPREEKRNSGREVNSVETEETFYRRGAAQLTAKLNDETNEKNDQDKKKQKSSPRYHSPQTKPHETVLDRQRKSNAQADKILKPLQLLSSKWPEQDAAAALRVQPSGQGGLINITTPASPYEEMYRVEATTERYRATISSDEQVKEAQNFQRESVMLEIKSIASPKRSQRMPTSQSPQKSPKGRSPRPSKK